MFSQLFENELWNIWSNKPLSVVLKMEPVLINVHRILCEEYKLNEMKINLIINHFNNLIKKEQFSIDKSNDSFENIVNLIFCLATINPLNSHPITINEFLIPLNGTAYFSFLYQQNKCLFFR
jgi:hypothetical protein